MDLSCPAEQAAPYRLHESSTKRVMTEAFESEPLSGRAVARIRDMIIRGQLVPRSRVSEKDLCEAFGISRTPLREALKVLASEGLVELLPRRGARITAIDIDRLREQFEAVALIESNAAHRLCESGTAEQIRDLRVIHDALATAHRTNDPARYYVSNEQFHRSIVMLAGNGTLADIHADLIVHLHRARNVALSRSDVDVGFAHAHDEIIEAIERRDADAAAAEVTEHQRAITETVLSALARTFAADAPQQQEAPASV
jgi:DNA-binding GntR family transcriptional regulator